MPRNDQVTRQWHILRTLEASRGLTLQELADRLPPDAPRHLRTIRRDVYALEASGFPLVSEPVDGQVRWRLMEGYRNVPVVPFSPTELMALVMSRRLLQPLEGTQIRSALDSALNKVSAALPPVGHDYVGQLDGVFSIGLGPHKSYRKHRDTVDRLTQAIGQTRTVQLRYFSAAHGKATRREVDPYRLWYASGGLYLVAYCHVRNDVRLFAVERIRSLTLTDHPYQMPLGFDFDAYVQDALTVMRGPRIEVELLFDKATADWMKDRIWHPSQHLVSQKGGRLKMTLQVADNQELIGWILSFGGGVQVIRPASLKAAIQQKARKILGRVGNDPRCHKRLLPCSTRMLCLWFSSSWGAADAREKEVAMWITGLVIALALWSTTAWAQTDFDPKYERDYNIFNPASRYQSDNPLNPANAYDPNSPFNPANRYDPGNPVNPSNRYSPNNPFNPANRYQPDNPLNPANRYNPNVPFASLDGGSRTRKIR